MTDETEKTEKTENTDEAKTESAPKKKKAPAKKKVATKKPPASATKKKQTKEDAPDAADVISKSVPDKVTVSGADISEDEDRVLLKMTTGVAYSTGSGVRFSKEHPFQLVSNAEAMQLVQLERFTPALADEAKSFYNR
jgi:hypothetical protein